MIARSFIIFGIFMLIGSLILAAVRGQDETIATADKIRSILGFMIMGFIFLGSGIAIKLINGFFNVVDKVNDFAESDEGKKLIKESQKMNKDPLGIRNENDW